MTFQVRKPPMKKVLIKNTSESQKNSLQCCQTDDDDLWIIMFEKYLMEANTLVFFFFFFFKEETDSRNLKPVSLSSNPGKMIEQVAEQSICGTKKRKAWSQSVDNAE